MKINEINGQVIINGAIKRYTACTAERFSNWLDNEHAIACAIVLDAIGKGRVKDGEQYNILNYAMTTVDGIETILEKLLEVKADRKPREMSAETKRKNYEKQLAKLQAKYGIND